MNTPHEHQDDSTSDDKFFEYYAAASATEETVQRFEAIYAIIMRVRAARNMHTDGLFIGDIGCGAGTQCRIWAGRGHHVRGLDINERLVELGEQRAREEALDIEFSVGSATRLPWEDGSLDVCLAPELLEHVPDWEAVLDECTRVLKPGGVVYLSTNNLLCPKQSEFELPLYSWYPGFLKRHYEKLAKTTRPELANHAEFPAVNWFTFYGLRKELARRGLGTALDSFDVADVDSKSAPARLAFKAIRAFAPLRLLAHVARPFTVVVAVRAEA